jgi:hypothetical protein
MFHRNQRSRSIGIAGQLQSETPVIFSGIRTADRSDAADADEALGKDVVSGMGFDASFLAQNLQIQGTDTGVQFPEDVARELW